MIKVINIIKYSLLVIGIWSLVIGASISHASTTLDPSRTIYLGRTLGMGGAHIGLSNDGEGLFTNPSGLVGLEFPQISGVSRRIFLDETAYSLVSYIIPTDYGSFGMGFAGASTGGSYPSLRDDYGRIVINPSLEVMSYDNNVLLLTYANDFNKLKNIPKLPKMPDLPLSLGMNLKFFSQSIMGGGLGQRGTAFNVDLAATYKYSSWLTLGGVMQNAIGANIKWSNSEDRLGGYYKLGCAVNILGSATGEALYLNNNNKLVGAFDVELPHDVLQGSMLMHGGLEWNPIKSIAVRGGLNQQQAGFGMTLGLGIIQDAFRFDYAYAPSPGYSGDNPHYFSLSYLGARLVTIDKKLKRRDNAITFIEPKDRFITSLEVIPVKLDLKYADVMDKKTTWTVPVFSSTSETYEIKEYHDLTYALFENQKIEGTGTQELKSMPMTYGRHVLSAVGYITWEGTWITTEAHVLRFDPFRDTPMNYWAIEPIALNATLGLITGYPDKTFKPEKGISRAELTTLLVKTLTVSPEVWKQATEAQKFKDVPIGHWAGPYINIAADLGLVKGYPDGTFKPKNVLIRSEGVAIIARYAKLPEKDFVAFPDLKEGFWANKHIHSAKEAGLLKFLEGKNFEHKKQFARSEAAEVLYRTAPVQKMVDNFWINGIVLYPAKTASAEVKTTAAVTGEAKILTSTSEAKTTTSPTIEVKP